MPKATEARSTALDSPDQIDVRGRWLADLRALLPMGEGSRCREAGTGGMGFR